MSYTEHALAARWFTAGGNSPVHRIVVHTTETPNDDGAAAAIARYFHNVTDRHVSAHAVIDTAELWHCVGFGDEAYHAPPNAHSVGLELCGSSHWSADDWRQPRQQALLANAAAVVRQWCAVLDVPPRLLTTQQVADGLPGVCGHVNVSEAFHQSTHTDPGPAFPWAAFMLAVVGDTPAPQPPTTEGDPMEKFFTIYYGDAPGPGDDTAGRWAWWPAINRKTFISGDAAPGFFNNPNHCGTLLMQQHEVEGIKDLAG